MSITISINNLQYS